MFKDIVTKSQEYFPNLKIKYKNESLFMIILGTILFFNKAFMMSYVTTIGSTIYIPNKTYVTLNALEANIVLLHELVHIYDAKKLNKFLFGFLYLLPISLIILVLPLFLISWKLALPLILLSLLPLPAYFRMYFEKRAYISSLYVRKLISNNLNFDPELEKHKDFYLNQFKTSAYYFMWTFNLNKEFDQAIIKINNNERPYQDPELFNILEDLTKYVSLEE